MRNLILIVFACTALTGCMKTFSNENGPYITFTGQFVSDCNRNPVSGVIIQAIKRPQRNIFYSAGEKVLTEVESGNDGRFRIDVSEQVVHGFVSYETKLQYQLPGNTNFKDFEVIRRNILNDYEPGKIYDLGIIITENMIGHVNTYANVSPTLQAKDSLVIGISSNHLVFSPVPPQVHLTFTRNVVKGSSIDSPFRTSVKYATSINNLDKSNTSGNLYNNEFRVAVRACQNLSPDTITLNW